MLASGNAWLAARLEYRQNHGRSFSTPASAPKNTPAVYPAGSEHEAWPQEYQNGPCPDLEALLEWRENPDSWGVEVFRYCEGPASKWTSRGEFGEVTGLIKQLKKETRSAGFHVFDLVSGASSEAIRAIGFYRGITPLFYDIPFTHIRQGDCGCKDSLFFSLQFPAKYPEDVKLEEPRRANASSKLNFIEVKSGPGRQWRTSRLLFFARIRPQSQRRYYCQLFVDSVDVEVEEAVRALLVGDAHSVPLAHSDHIISVIAAVLYVIAEKWRDLSNDVSEDIGTMGLDDRECHLPRDQLTGEKRRLMKLLDLSRQIRWQIMAVEDLITGVVTHPFIEAEGLGGKMKAALWKVNRMLGEGILRIDEISDDIKVRVMAIFSIMMARDARAIAIVEQETAAKRLAASAQGIEPLTFLCFLIAVAAMVYIGVSISERINEAPPEGIMTSIIEIGVVFILVAASTLIWRSKR
ncbi:hypothetical protein TWF718_003502 [Orbilia javanica]|uniref:Uncharacterized protein n=1 Tax=Orbilia javanica TaxID=47235 RepID=A0AAN8R934_9PEZI